VANFRVSALQEAGLYDLIVNDDAFKLFDMQSNKGDVSVLNI